jgi:hypothetical protein
MSSVQAGRDRYAERHPPASTDDSTIGAEGEGAGSPLADARARLRRATEQKRQDQQEQRALAAMTPQQRSDYYLEKAGIQ